MAFGKLGDMAKLMKNMGGLQKQMEEQQRELEATQVAGEAGAGAVKVVMTAKHNLISVDISDESWSDGKAVVADLIVAAHNDAMAKSEAIIKEKMSGFTDMLGGM